MNFNSKLFLFFFLLSFLYISNSNGQDIILDSKLFVNSNKYIEINPDSNFKDYSLFNLSFSSSLKFKTVGLESGFRLENRRKKNDPAFYLTIPLKILVLTERKKFSFDFGFGGFYSISSSKKYKNDLGLLLSGKLNLHLNPKYSISYELSYLKGLRYVYSFERFSGTFPGGGSRDYRISTISNAIGIAYNFNFTRE